VIDGDTALVHIRVWTNVTVTIHARLAGIDAPEMRGAKCDAEKELAVKAKSYLSRLIIEEPLTVQVIGFDSFDRALTLLQTKEGSVTDLMLEAGLAVVYDADNPADWCSTPERSRGKDHKDEEKTGLLV
jgi:endonuclease YncB( thermonuclease family)